VRAGAFGWAAAVSEVVRGGGECVAVVHRSLHSSVGTTQLESPTPHPTSTHPPPTQKNPSAARKLRWNPVQLLECRDFLNNESAFMEWLHMAVIMASTAVLLLAVGALAFVSPLDKPGVYIAECTALLLLPTSCCVVGYAMWVYQWRSVRLQSMRHRRVDDAAGANAMLFVIVLTFVGVLVLNVCDLVLVMRGEGGGDDDDPSGSGGGESPG